MVIYTPEESIFPDTAAVNRQVGTEGCWDGVLFVFSARNARDEDIRAQALLHEEHTAVILEMETKTDISPGGV